MLTLADIIDAKKGVRTFGANLVVTEVVIDSRNTSPGSLFIALPGEHVNGHDYIDDA